MTREQQQGVIAAIRALGFVGNMHYCPDCGNHFHDTGGQHEPDCGFHQEVATDEDWWDVEWRLRFQR